ncbi:MAG: J domain-containing protein [Acetobacteraceae bacterium]|nr:J domain-containing protein [Acetobacteraceae bacterium]
MLGIGESVDDTTIKQRYLALVRAFPPDREPDRFQEIRQAYEAVRTVRGRLEVQLLQSRSHALSRLKLQCLEQTGGDRRRASAAAVAALVLDGLRRVQPQDG